MLDGEAIARELATRRASGAGRGELLSAAVRLIHGAEGRVRRVGIYLLEPGATAAGKRPAAGEVGAGAGSSGELILDNYLGRPTEHVRIPVGKGVRGLAVARGTDINVPDVREVEGSRASSRQPASELVVLIRDPASGRIFGQIDLDSDRPAAFTDRDQRELRVVADWLAGLFV